MRLLRINGQSVDLDEQTAIGLDIQGYDVKNPGQRIVSVTNTFTIPATSRNLGVFGVPNSPFSTSTKIYNLSTVDYWVDNEKLIDDARVRVEAITDRISLFVYKKPEVWDLLKQVTWRDFVPDYLDWLADKKGVPLSGNPFAGTWSEFVGLFLEDSDFLHIPFYYGNLFRELDVIDFIVTEKYVYAEDENIWLQYYDADNEIPKAKGGHFCTYFRHVFEYIEDAYGVNFGTSGGVFPGNIFDDAYGAVAYTPIRDIYIFQTESGYHLSQDYTSDFVPLEGIEDKPDKTLYDCVNTFFQQFNIIVDEVEIDQVDYFALRRFDDLETFADVKDFSGKLSGMVEYKPKIDGYAQDNFIKYGTVYENGAELFGAKNITCQNKNIDARKDLFTIDAHIPGVVKGLGVFALDLSQKEAFKTFQVLVDTGEKVSLPVGAKTSTWEETTTENVNVAGVYSLENEYNLLKGMLQYPTVYNVKKWLTFNDITDIQFFRLYYFQELGGSFFLNKISGFNPQKSNDPTKVELIKVSDKTPVSPPDLNYWVDGVIDGWTDAFGDLFY